jgi:hypothetical protein
MIITKGTKDSWQISLIGLFIIAVILLAFIHGR